MLPAPSARRRAGGTSQALELLQRQREEGGPTRPRSTGRTPPRWRQCRLAIPREASGRVQDCPHASQRPSEERYRTPAPLDGRRLGLHAARPPVASSASRLPALFGRGFPQSAQHISAERWTEPRRAQPHLSPVHPTSQPLRLCSGGICFVGCTAAHRAGLQPGLRKWRLDTLRRATNVARAGRGSTVRSLLTPTLRLPPSVVEEDGSCDKHRAPKLVLASPSSQGRSSELLPRLPELPPGDLGYLGHDPVLRAHALLQVADPDQAAARTHHPPEVRCVGPRPPREPPQPYLPRAGKLLEAARTRGTHSQKSSLEPQCYAVACKTRREALDSPVLVLNGYGSRYE